MNIPSIQYFLQAAEILRPVVEVTPLTFSHHLSHKLNKKIYLKQENQQLTGSFKIRGAFHKMTSLSSSEREKGVVASSAGNHAQGVAYSAKKLNIKAHIVMPKWASNVKINNTKSHGAHVYIYGDRYEAAEQEALRLKKEKEYTFIHPYEDEKIILGQGTLALEILNQLPDVQSVVVPIGGGGLISGIAAVIKAQRPQCKVYGVQSDQAYGMYSQFKRQESKDVKAPLTKPLTIADGIAIKKPSEDLYRDFISPFVEDIVLVSDEEIAATIAFLLEKEKILVEGSGAASLASVLYGKLQAEEPCCVVLSGGNIDLNLLAKVIERGLLIRGQIISLCLIVPDLPGTLQNITQIISKHHVNIIQIQHERNAHGLSLKEARVQFLLETQNPEQIDHIKESLKEFRQISPF